MPFTTAAGGSHDVIDRTCSCGTLYRPAPTNSVWNALPSRSDQFRLAPQIQGRSPLE